VSLIVTVAAFTVPLNTVPFDWLTVTVPMFVPTAPMLAVLSVLIVRLATGALPGPVIVPALIALAAPAPKVSSAEFARLAGPTVICPVLAPPIVALAVTLTAADPKFSTPTPAALIVPATLSLDGAVAIAPAVNAMPAPIVRLPAFEKVVAAPPVMLPPPFKAIA
jgi:hypothetical protein